MLSLINSDRKKRKSKSTVSKCEKRRRNSNKKRISTTKSKKRCDRLSLINRKENGAYGWPSAKKLSKNEKLSLSA